MMPMSMIGLSEAQKFCNDSTTMSLQILVVVEEVKQTYFCM